MRREFEMTEDQLENLLDACKPSPCIKVGTYAAPTPQQKANWAWASLGEQMGFEPMSVKPMQGKGDRFFTAEAIELAQA